MTFLIDSDALCFASFMIAFRYQIPKTKAFVFFSEIRAIFENIRLDFFSVGFTELCICNKVLLKSL